MKYEKLGSFAEIKSGYTFRGVFPSVPGGRVVVFQPRDIISGNKNNLVRIAAKSVPDGHFIEKGTVLLTNRGTFCARVFNDKFAAVTTSGVFVVRVSPECGVLPEFLALYINSDIGQRQMASKLEVMTVPALTIRQIQELEVPVMSKHKQEMLVKMCGVCQHCEGVVLEIQKQTKSFVNQVLKGVIDG